MVLAVAAAAVGLGMPLTPSPIQLQAVEERQRSTKPARRKVNFGFAENTPKWRRSRGAQAKPRKRPNRRIISKRVRRKHRRARR
jgi:hypothetical protein